MRFLFAIFLCALAATGCVAPNQVMVNPDNGATVDCSSVGWGWAGAPMALIAHERCIERYRQLGFISAEEYRARDGVVRQSGEPASIKITSDPPGARVMAGADQAALQPIGFTPLEFKHPKGGRAWRAECYQVTLDGYQTPECACRNLEMSDRLVHFELKKIEISGQ